MATNFDKTGSQRIELGTLSDYTTQISVAAWVQRASIPGGAEFYTIFSKAATGTDRNIGIDYRLRSAVPTIEIYWTQPVGTFIEYSSSITGLTTNWTSIIVTIDWTTNPDTVALYINGLNLAALASGSNNATPTTGSPALNNIGSLGASSYWDGNLAEVSLWPGYILTAGEVGALSKGFAPFVVHPTGLEIYSQLIREVQDYKGLTLTNHGTTGANNHPPVIYAG